MTAEMGQYDLSRVDSAPQAPWDERLTAYERWSTEQGLPVERGFYIADLAAVKTGPWEAVGAQGAIVELEGTAQTNGAYVLRIEPGEGTNWLKHLYEEVFYVVEGEGITEVRAGRGLATCRWRAGSVFSPPLNVGYRHIATTETVMYCVHTAPLVMNLFHNEKFVMDNPFEFDDRFDGREGFFSSDGRLWKRQDGAKIWDTTFVEDSTTFELPDLPGRGAGGRSISFQFSENTLIAHISEFPTGTYKKGHRHGPGAHVILLGGDGYSLLWQQAYDEHQKVDWGKNAVFVPPNYWWHQHFNIGRSPARYLAVRWGSAKHPLDHSYERTIADRRKGGTQIEYDDQDPRVHDQFVNECNRHGVTVREEALKQ